MAKPFPQEEELAQKSARLAELNAQLDVDEKHHEPEQDEEEKEDAPRALCWLYWKKRQRKRNPSSLSNPISTRTVMPGERKTG